MKLQEACERLNKLVGIKFKDLFSPEDMEDIIIAKGKTGRECFTDRISNGTQIVIGSNNS